MGTLLMGTSAVLYRHAVQVFGPQPGLEPETLWFPTYRPSSHKGFCNLVLQNNIGKTMRTRGGGAIFTCAGEAVFHHSCCSDALSVMREAELKLTTKLQPPEGLVAFCRLIFVGELLQLKVRHRKSPDIYLSVNECDLARIVSHCDDVRPPAIKSKEVVGQVNTVGVAQTSAPHRQGAVLRLCGAKPHLDTKTHLRMDRRASISQHTVLDRKLNHSCNWKNSHFCQISEQQY